MAVPIITRILIPAVTSLLVIFSTATADAGPTGWPPDGSFIRITRDGGVSPWVSIYYDVTVRGSTLVVSLVKDTTCRVVARERLELVDGAEADRIIERLKSAGAFSPALPEGALIGRAADTPSASDMPRYEFWAARGPKMTRFSVTRPQLDSDSDLTGLYYCVHEIVTGLVEPLPMRDVFHPADETGIVAITASEPAVAVIDGWDRVRLPVSSLDLKVGVHQVVVRGQSGATRNFTVRIVPGENAAIHVLLGDKPPASSTER